MFDTSLDNITILLHQTHAEVARNGAGIMARVINDRPRSHIGLATGGTQDPLYAELCEINARSFGALNLANINFSGLDEYIGLPREHIQTYDFYYHNRFFKPANISREHIHLLNGMAGDHPAECARFEKVRRELGPAALQLAGVGVDGHLGFCHVGADPFGRTFVSKLSRQTRKSNARYFGNRWKNVPPYAFTKGLGTILEAEMMLVLVNGSHKRDAMRGLLDTEPSNMPIRELRRHPNVVLILDVEAFPYPPEVLKNWQADRPSKLII